MAEAPTLFFDIGGVILTNAWDTAARNRAAEAFGLDNVEFQTRHGMVKTAFETGRLSLDGYVKKTVFHRSRTFSPDDFKTFMYSQSKPLTEALTWVRELAASGKYRLYSLNNESRELHEYRVRTYKLDTVFRGFCTSCYLRDVKPDEDIYLNALGIASCGHARPSSSTTAPSTPKPLRPSASTPSSTPTSTSSARPSTNTASTSDDGPYNNEGPRGNANALAWPLVMIYPEARSTYSACRRGDRSPERTPPRLPRRHPAPRRSRSVHPLPPESCRPHLTPPRRPSLPHPSRDCGFWSPHDSP